MELVLYSPDEKIINEGDSLDSKLLFLDLTLIENENMYFIANGNCLVE